VIRSLSACAETRQRPAHRPRRAGLSGVCLLQPSLGVIPAPTPRSGSGPPSGVGWRSAKTVPGPYVATRSNHRVGDRHQPDQTPPNYNKGDHHQSRSVPRPRAGDWPGQRPPRVVVASYRAAQPNTVRMIEHRTNR